MAFLARIPPRRKPRRGPPRSKKYLAFIHGFTCLVCGLILVEAAHTYNGLRGMSQKSSDFGVIALCDWHHKKGEQSLDKIGLERFQQLHGVDVRAAILGYQQKFIEAGGVVAEHNDDWWRKAA